MNKVLRSLFYIFLPLIVGGIVGGIIQGKIDYSNLNQPFLSPPKIVFPIAWTILYLLMGVSYFLFRRKNENKETSIYYYLQLIVNALWSVFFFVLKWRLFSIFWILLLIILVSITMYQFYKNEKISAYLFIPYLLWLFFATYLNIGIYFLN